RITAFAPIRGVSATKRLLILVSFVVILTVLSVVLDPAVRDGVHALTREDGIDRGDVGLGKRPAERADVVFHFGDGAAADERRADDRVRDRPAKRELRETAAVTGGEAFQLLHHAQVAREALGAEERVEELDRAHLIRACPPVVGAAARAWGERARHQAVNEP